MLVKVNDSNYVRDTNSMALLNSDNNGLKEYISKRKLLQAQREEINTIKSEVNDLKQDLSEIKSMVLQLLNKGPHV